MTFLVIYTSGVCLIYHENLWTPLNPNKGSANPQANSSVEPSSVVRSSHGAKENKYHMGAISGAQTGKMSL